MNVIEFPKSEQPELLFGPIMYRAIIVEGRMIPLLTGHTEDDQNTWLVVDRRFSISVPNELAHQVAWLLANAIAVASGYTHLGATSKNEKPFAPIVTKLDDIPK